MAESPPSARSPRRTGGRIGRRRGRVFGLLVLGALAVLIGRGLGLVGREPSPDLPPVGDGDHADSGGAGTPPASGAPAAPSPATQSPALPSPAAPSPAAPLAEATPAATPPQPELPGIDADRFASLLSVLDTCAQRGDVGGALATLHQLRQMPLNEPQHLALGVSARAVENDLAAACAEVEQLLREGRVLDGHAAIVRLLGDGDPLTQPWLQSALQAAGLGTGPLQKAPARDEPIPQPQALARGRAVRVRAGTAVTAAVVADSRSDQVTLRIENKNGLSFPTHARSACEPVAATRDEAIEMAFAALHAGDALLARLWLACARLRDTSPLPPRGERLAALLR